MNFQDRLILFDIDGTLLSAGSSGYHALERSIIDILGLKRGLAGISLEGNTDLNAIRQVCERDGRAFPDPETMAEFKANYCKILRTEIAGKGHLKPGVNELLDALTNSKRCCMGLVTGNMREGAQIKLERFSLDKYFSFGAFGCEYPSRADLVGLAIERATAFSSISFAPNQIILIGDTIHDIASCRPWGIRCLAVATGTATQEELEKAGAAWVLSDLADSHKVLELLLEK